MAKKLAVGDIVVCRYFNTPEGKFYGLRWKAKIVRVENGPQNERPPTHFRVKKEDGYELTVQRKEILRRIS